MLEWLINGVSQPASLAWPDLVRVEKRLRSLSTHNRHCICTQDKGWEQEAAVQSGGDLVINTSYRAVEN